MRPLRFVDQIRLTLLIKYDIHPTFLVHGNWGSWTEYSTCDVTCGGGQQRRIRLCNSPSAENAGLDCLLTGETEKRAKQESETKGCNQQKCPGT